MVVWQREVTEEITVPDTVPETDEVTEEDEETMEGEVQEEETGEEEVIVEMNPSRAQPVEERVIRRWCVDTSTSLTKTEDHTLMQMTRGVHS